MKSRQYSTNYPEGDFLIRVKNAALAGNNKVTVRSNKFIENIAKLLLKERILSGVTKEGKNITVNLSFHKKQPLLTDLKLVTRPGLRVYWSVDEIESKKGPFFYVLSTPQGVMSSRDAIKKNVGGEVVAQVF